MRQPRHAAVAALAASLAIHASALAEGPRPSLEGFTGQLATPSAWTIAPGSAHLLLTNADDPRFRESVTTRTYALTLGLLRYTEVAGRLTEAWPTPRLRDLSFNLKLQLPLDLVAPRLPVAFAVGAQDEGGAATNFATRYAVASVRAWRLTASVGWGLGPSRMEGLFGGGTLALADWMELVGDWDGTELNAGVRWSVPLRAVGLPFRLGAIAKSPLERRPRLLEWAATLELPLWLHALPTGERRPPEEPPTPPPRSARPALARWAASSDGAGGHERSSLVREQELDDSAPTVTDPLLDLEDGLVAIGLEEVRAGRAGELVVVEYENSRFNHDEADALYLVLREIERVGLAGRPLAIVVKRQGLRVAEISVPAAAAVAAPPDSGARPSWRYWPPGRRVLWASRSPRNRTALHSRLVLAPGLRSFVGTEVGMLDYVLSLQSDLIVPFWPGATGFVRANVPFSWTDDLDDREIFRRYREPRRLVHALVHQALPLAGGLTALVGGGVFRSTDAGGLGEIMWTPGDGTLALGVQGSWTVNDVGTERQALTGSARLRIAPLDVELAVRSGRFVLGDRGTTVDLSRWFGDTQVGVFFTRTAGLPTLRTDEPIGMAGAFLTVPLTPRRDMRPGWLQVRGSRRWGHAMGTVVGQDRNPIVVGLGIAPISPWNLETSYLDWGRISRDGLVEPLRALPALSR